MARITPTQISRAIHGRLILHHFRCSIPRQLTVGDKQSLLFSARFEFGIGFAHEVGFAYEERLMEGQRKTDIDLGEQTNASSRLQFRAGA